MASIKQMIYEISESLENQYNTVNRPLKSNRPALSPDIFNYKLYNLEKIIWFHYAIVSSNLKLE